jgi:hypothetical protein
MGVKQDQLLSVIQHQLNWEKRFPVWLLNFGPFSKMMMILNFLTRPAI